jgi:hypothetical protein
MQTAKRGAVGGPFNLVATNELLATADNTRPSHIIDLVVGFEMDYLKHHPQVIPALFVLESLQSHGLSAPVLLQCFVSEMLNGPAG